MISQATQIMTQQLFCIASCKLRGTTAACACNILPQFVYRHHRCVQAQLRQPSAVLGGERQVAAIDYILKTTQNFFIS